MKKVLFHLFIILFCTVTFSQQKMKIILNDGTEKIGVFKIDMPAFGNNSSATFVKSIETKEKYKLKDFSSIIVYSENGNSCYEVIDVKTNFSDRKTSKKLGLIEYVGSKMEIFYVAETVHSGGGVGGFGTVGGMFHKFIKKTDDKVAYNMGYIYGAGARGIKKRVRDYFTDCPKLIENVDKDVINKDNLIEIVKFYETNCGGK